MQQAPAFPELLPPPPRHPVVGEQKDIRYYGTTVTGVLNSPETTGMSFWSINPYIGCAFGCTYCYARYAHRFVMERQTGDGGRETGDTHSPVPEVPSLADDLEELPPWLAFERRIFVKRNAAQALRRTLQGRSKSLGAVQRGEPIVIGTATDPYQPAERHFRITRELLEVLAEAKRLRLVIITKSPLITRDVALLERIAQRSRLTVHLSLITLDRELARRVEPRAPTPESRLRALRRLSAAGIDVGINIMPVLPGITDRPDALAALVRAVADGGASHVNACALRLRVTSRRRYLPWLEQEFPELTARYERAYGRDFQITDRYREGLRQFLKRVCRKARIRYGSPEERAFEGPADGGSARAPARAAGRATAGSSSEASNEATGSATDGPTDGPIEATDGSVDQRAGQAWEGRAAMRRARSRVLPVMTEGNEEDRGTGNADSVPITDPQFALGL